MEPNGHQRPRRRHGPKPSAEEQALRLEAVATAARLRAHARAHHVRHASEAELQDAIGRRLAALAKRGSHHTKAAAG